MEVTLLGWLLAVVAAGALFLLYVLVLRLVLLAQPRRALPSALLVASICAFLALYAEVRLVSLLPLARPLAGLPAYHLILLGGLWVLLRAVGRRHPPGSRRSVRAELRAAWRGLGRAPRSVLVALVPLLVVNLLFGLYTVGFLWDDLNYHIPLAIQPYADGRVDVCTDDRPQALYFPRGVETAWYWTLQHTGTDLLFRPVLLAFGLQALLAVYVLARRSGAADWAAALAVAALASAPIFFLLTARGHVDIAYAALIVTSLAFLAPGREAGLRPRQDWFWALLAFGAAALVKFPILAAILLGFGFCGSVLAVRRRPAAPAPPEAAPSAGWGRELAAFAAWRLPLALVLVALCLHTYYENWRATGNPLYPFSVRVAGRELLAGPHVPDATNSGGESSARTPVKDMSLIERYYRSWTDFDVPLTIESFGAFGPVLPFGFLAPALVFGLSGFTQRRLWRAALFLGIIAALLLTPAAVPRYGVAVVAVILACGAVVLSAPRLRYAWPCTVTVLLLCVASIAPVARGLPGALRLHRTEAGLSMLRRNYYFHEVYQTGSTWFASPTLTRYIREHVTGADTLVWNVRTFPTLLRSRDWRNRVLHLPASAAEVYPGKIWEFPPVTPEEVESWITRLRALNPEYVLVYSVRPYAARLREAPELGYTVAYEDAETAGPHRMTLFRRNDARPTD